MVGAGIIGLATSDVAMSVRMRTAEGPSWRETLFIVGLIGACIGYAGWLAFFSQVVVRAGGVVGRGALLDGFVIGLSLATVFSLAVVLPQIQATDVNVGDHLVLVGCLAADAWLIWLCLTVTVADTRNWRALLYSVGVVLHIAADTVHSVVIDALPMTTRLLLGEGLAGTAFVVWLAAPFVARRWSRRSPSNLLPTALHQVVAGQRIARPRLMAMVVALALPGTVIAWRLWIHEPGPVGVFLVAAPLLVFLVALRIKGLVADLAASNSLLAHQATHDHLTGALNRAAVAELMEHPDSEVRAIIYLDLDGFKAVNDGHGHAAGDAVLVEVVQRLQAGVRGSDRVARMGGDEFAVLVSDVDTDFDTFAPRLDRLLNAKPYLWNDRELAVGASVGVARSLLDSMGRPSMGSDELMSMADEAMLEAKTASHARRPQSTGSSR